MRRAISKRRFLLLALAAGLVMGKEAPAQFINGGFEIGASGMPPQSWVVMPYLNYSGFMAQTPQTEGGLDLTDGGDALTESTNSPTGAGSQPDPDLGPSASLRWPRYGNQCALVNENGRNYNVNSLSQSTTVDSSMIDPIDGQMHVSFVIAPVLENPHHEPFQQPYYFIQLTDDTQGTLLYSDMGTLNDTNFPWQSVMTNDTEYDYTDWQLVDIVPGTNAAPGDQVTLTAIASGCALGGHMGQMYVDGVGNSIDGIFVTGAAAPAAIPGCELTYTLTYRNGSASAEAGVVLYFNTPLNTTFQSVNAPGLVAAAPQAGTAGAVICTLTNLASGASGSFTVTVNINPGTTGTITERNYSIRSDVETPLLGPKVSTLLVNLYPIVLSGPTLSGDGSFFFSFTNVAGVSFTVLSTTNVSLPFSQWSVSGSAVEDPEGTYTFCDSGTNRGRFYGVRSP